MWRKLSLRARINVLIGLMLALGLAANVARLVLEAGPRIQAEDRSVIRLVSEVLGSLAPAGHDNADANDRLDRIVADLNRLRHVTISKEGKAPASSAPPQQEGPDSVRSPPSWFTALVHPERISVSVPIQIGETSQTLSITSHPDDEMLEIWDGIVTQLALGVLVALALFVVTSSVIRHALTPLDALSRAMIDIEAGQYRARVPLSGAPELNALCDRVNHLAQALDDALEDRRELAERMVSVQDSERKDIARDLHDEFGPHLFALRAHAGAVMRLAARDSSVKANLSEHGAAILSQIDAMQQFNRRVLERLRPAGLADLGLSGAIDVLVRLWRQISPEVVIESDISPALDRFSDVAELTAYRVVQEALTNAYRHAQATRVNLAIYPGDPASTMAKRDSVIVRVSDNGIGIGSERRSGFGLIGMRERVWALGGILTISSQADGVIVEAVIPVDGPIPAEEDRENVPVLSGH